MLADAARHDHHVCRFRSEGKNPKTTPRREAGLGLARKQLRDWLGALSYQYFLWRKVGGQECIRGLTCMPNGAQAAARLAGRPELPVLPVAQGRRTKCIRGLSCMPKRLQRAGPLLKLCSFHGWSPRSACIARHSHDITGVVTKVHAMCHTWTCVMHW